MTPLLAQRPRADRAFERLYQRHVGDVYRYALVVLRNQADAEDVTQTTFMNAYRAYQRGERPRQPQNWLITIAHNVCRQRFRQSARRPSEVALQENIAEAVVADDDAPSADDIRRALSHLAFNQRAALVMRELEGRSYAEIAEILSLSVSAVETLIFRARRALREQLEGGLTCHEAELAISKQLDGRLPRAEKGALRAHLRECEECAHFARSQRAQRTAIKSLAAIPIPSSLASFFGGGGGAAVATGGAAAGGGLAIKAALVGAAAIVATGVGYEGAKQAGWRSKPSAHRPTVRPKPAPTLAAAAAHARTDSNVESRVEAKLEKLEQTVKSDRPKPRHAKPQHAKQEQATDVRALPPGQAKKIGAAVAKPNKGRSALSRGHRVHKPKQSGKGRGNVGAQVAPAKSRGRGAVDASKSKNPNPPAAHRAHGKPLKPTIEPTLTTVTTVPDESGQGKGQGKK